MIRKNKFICSSKQQGFTLFELMIVVLIIGVFMSFAIDRMLQIEISAERVSVQQVIGALTSAVNLQAAEMIVDKGLNAIRVLENTNPMRYLSETPYNYSGIKSDKGADSYAQASWYYDPQQKILFYKVKNKNYFESSLAGTPRIRLKVALVYKDGISRGRSSKVQGIRVKSLDEYQWKFD